MSETKDKDEDKDLVVRIRVDAAPRILDEVASLVSYGDLDAETKHKLRAFRDELQRALETHRAVHGRGPDS